MKKIGLISDTHGFLDPSVFKYFEECDEIWHAGDAGSVELLDELGKFKTLRAVYGNIDDHRTRSAYPEHQRFILEGVNVWMTHIGGRPGNYATPIRPALKIQPPDLFICGHSHLCLVKYDTPNKMLYMNPGAAGYHGFHKVRTLLRFALNNGKIEQLDVIELHPRHVSKEAKENKS